MTKASAKLHKFSSDQPASSDYKKPRRLHSLSRETISNDPSETTANPCGTLTKSQGMCLPACPNLKGSSPKPETARADLPWITLLQLAAKGLELGFTTP